MTSVFDMSSLMQILLAALIGGLIGLDRTALGQFMISQPLVAAPLTGWALGHPAAGLVIGGSLELLWLLDIPVGTFVPADSTVAAVAATAIAIIGSAGEPTVPVVGFCLLLTVLMVPITKFADRLMRTRNASIPEHALSRTGRPSEASVTFWHLAGMVAFFLKPFVLCLVIVPAGAAAVSGFLRLPAASQHAMTLFIALLPLAGVASMARKLSMHIADRTLLIGFLVGAVWSSILQLPVVIGVLLAATAGLLEVRYRAS